MTDHSNEGVSADEDGSRATVIRGHVVTCLRDPSHFSKSEAILDIGDGLVIMRDGVIIGVGPYEAMVSKVPPMASVRHFPGSLIVPGFIDAHVHYAQTPMIASHGATLLEWLTKYTFPNEERFASLDYSREVATKFYDELLRNGTTTALAFCTVFRDSTDAFFEEALNRNMRMIGGKVLMDRNAPLTLTDTVESGYEDSRALIERWHGRGRLRYAITPRFAPTSSEAQIRSAAALRDEFPDCLIHSHVSETREEIEWVRELFPDRWGYLDVYDEAGILGDTTVLAHGVYLTDRELDRMGETSTALVHCPTSNTFLGSGLLSLKRVRTVRPNVKVGLGTDVGAGTSFSLLATMGETYKVAALTASSTDAYELFYLATLGGAHALGIQNYVGSLAAGKEADVVVLDPNASALLSYRMQRATSSEEELFVLAILGDDRCVSATYVAGDLVYERSLRDGRD